MLEVVRGLSRPRRRGYPPADAEADRQPPSLAAAGRARDAAVGLATDLATDVVDGFKKSSRTLRRKAAVVGTWLLLSVVTMWAACPSSGPTNSLGAVARLQATSVGQVISVRNDTDGTIWTEVALVLDDTWRYEKRRTIRAGDTVTPRVEDFRKDDQPPPAGYRPAEAHHPVRAGAGLAPAGREALTGAPVGAPGQGRSSSAASARRAASPPAPAATPPRAAPPPRAGAPPGAAPARRGLDHRRLGAARPSARSASTAARAASRRRRAAAGGGRGQRAGVRRPGPPAPGHRRAAPRPPPPQRPRRRRGRAAEAGPPPRPPATAPGPGPARRSPRLLAAGAGRAAAGAASSRRQPPPAEPAWPRTARPRPPPAAGSASSAARRASARSVSGSLPGW